MELHIAAPAEPRNLPTYIAAKCQLWHIIAMKFEYLLEIVDREPVFNSGMLVSGEVDQVDLGRPLSRCAVGSARY